MAPVRAGSSAGRGRRGPGVPGGGAVPDEDDLGAVAGVASARHPFREVGTGIVAAQRLGIGSVEHGEPHRGVEPSLGPPRELGIDGESGCQHVSGSLGDVAEPLEVGPRPLGVDVIGGHG
jgi:hypothetical protein